jgi:hypothetical protein
LISQSRGLGDVYKRQHPLLVRLLLQLTINQTSPHWEH